MLEEPDSLTVGRVGGLAVDAAGNLYVADALAGRVLRYDNRGRLEGTIARKGSGPGELGSPGPMTMMGDSLLVVLDIQRRQPFAFRARDGRLVRAGRPIGVPTYVLSVHSSGDALWIGFVDPGRGTAVAVWNPASDSALRLVALPDEYRDTGLEYWQPGAHALPWRDTVLVGLLGLPDLLVADSSGAVLGRIAMPVRSRRGVPHDLAAIYRRDGIGENEVSILSILWAMHRLPSGTIAVVHLDMSPDTSEFRIAHTAAFLTFLNQVQGERCVDIELPAPGDPRPAFAFRGDSLWMLEQRITPDARAELFVRLYALDASAC